MSNKNKKAPYKGKVDDSTTQFEWTSFPLIDRPATSALLLVFLVFLAVLLRVFVTSAMQLSMGWYFAGMLLILISLIPYFIPSTYTFYNNRIEVKYLIHKVKRPYSDFGCFYCDKLGFMLSTFKRPRRLDPFRGLSVRFSKTQAERTEIIAFLEKKIGTKF